MHETPDSTPTTIRGTAFAARRVLRHLRHDVGHDAADAQARQKAQRAEGHRIVGQARGRGEDTEEADADRNRAEQTGALAAK